MRGRPSTCSPPHPRCREGPPSACSRGPMAFRAVWSACTGAGSRPVPSRQSRKGSEQAGSGPSRIGPASATGGPGSSRLKATPATWARFCCCHHAVLGVDARRSVGRSEGPDLGRCPARSPPGEWESGTSAFFFSIKPWWHRPCGVESRHRSRLLRWFGWPGEGGEQGCPFPGLSPLH